MRPAPVDIDEVDDIAGHRPVDEIAKRAAKNQRQSETGDPFMKPELRRVGRNRDQRHGRDANHDQWLVRKISGIEQPEGGTGIVDVGEVQEVGNDRAAFAKRQHLPDDRLGELVAYDEGL